MNKLLVLIITLIISQNSFSDDGYEICIGRGCPTPSQGDGHTSGGNSGGWNGADRTGDTGGGYSGGYNPGAIILDSQPPPTPAKPPPPPPPTPIEIAKRSFGNYPSSGYGYDFKTEKNSTHFASLEQTQKYIDNTRNWVNNSVPDEEKWERKQLLNYANLNVELADRAFSGGKILVGQNYLKHAIEATDFVFDFVPGASFVKDAITIMSGINPITGEMVSDTERAVMASMLLVPSALAGTGKGLYKLSKVLKKVAKSSGALSGQADSILNTLRKSDRDLFRVSRDLPCVRSASILSFFMSSAYACNSLYPGRITGTVVDEYGAKQAKVFADLKTSKSISNIVEVDPKKLNAPMIEKGYEPAWHESKRAVEMTLEKDKVFKRLHQHEGNANRSWVHGLYDPTGDSKKVLADKFALPGGADSINYLSDIKVPAGTKVRGGFASPNKFGKGEGFQWEILEDRIPNEWVVRTEAF